MSRIKQRQLRVLLLADDIRDLDDVIRAIPGARVFDVTSDMPYEGRVVIRQSESRIPDWLEFLTPAIDGPMQGLSNSLSGGLLLLRVTGRLFAVTFGQGRTLVSQNAHERGFGLRVVLNAVDPGQVRSIDDRSMEDLVLTRRRQASRAASLDVFGLDVTRDLLRSVTGVPRDRWLGKKITGSDALTCSLAADVSQVGDVCNRLLSIYRSNDYKTHFGFVDNLRKEAQPSLIGELESRLDADLASGDTSHLYLAPPTVVDWEAGAGFVYSSSLSTSQYSDLDFDDFAASHRSDWRLTAESLRHTHISLRADNGADLDRWPAFNCVIYETEIGDRLYVLCEGDWYSVERDFAKRVAEDMHSLAETRLTLPNATAGETEPEYIERVAASPDYLQMHGKPVGVAGARSPIEFCDLLTNNRELVHIKRRVRSATLSHLFAQGAISAEEFASDAEFRERVRRKIEDVDPAFSAQIPEERPHATHRVVFAIISQHKGNDPGVLPFFSKLNASNAARHIRRLGLDASVLMVEQEGKYVRIPAKVGRRASSRTG
jgi:uncharacterized protein (TIGR04141 family)